MTEGLTATRAAGVLNAAMQYKMFPEGAIPESDGDKISEAGKLVALAQQGAVVAATIGPASVPNYQAIVSVLEAAGLTDNGTPVLPSAAAPPAPPAPAPAPPPPPVVQAPVEPAPEPAPVAPAPPVPAAEAQPQPPAPPASAPVAAAPAPTDPGDPVNAQKDEIWLDHDGLEWQILQYSGGPQAQAKSLSTGADEIIPIGLLKSRKGAASPPAPEPTPPPVPTPPAAVPQPAAPAVPPPPPAAAVVEPPPPAPAPVDDDEGDPLYAEALEKAERNYTVPGMPTPMELADKPTDFPQDLTTVGDLEARRLHSQFNALSARARYLYGLEAAKAKECSRIRKHRIKGPMSAARAELGKDASLAEVTARAEEDESISPWIEREERHSARAEAYKTFLSIYAENVSVLSRDWTMRAAEEQGS